jgi:RNA polymerase sigma-70 factor (ECF subfamily)
MRRKMTYEQTILPHRDALYRLAWQLTRDPCDAQDLVQETLARAFTRFHLLRAEGAALVWLRCMLRNLFLNQQDRVRREQEHTGGSAAVSLEALEGMGAVSCLPTEHLTPERVVLGQIEAAAIRRAIAALPASYKECVILGHLEGLSYQEIAERTGLSVTTVRTRLHRGRRHIQKSLQAQGFVAVE